MMTYFLSVPSNLICDEAIKDIRLHMPEINDYRMENLANESNYLSNHDLTS